jgi:hypothetical protein
MFEITQSGFHAEQFEHTAFKPVFGFAEKLWLKDRRMEKGKMG